MSSGILATYVIYGYHLRLALTTSITEEPANPSTSEKWPWKWMESFVT